MYQLVYMIAVIVVSVPFFVSALYNYIKSHSNKSVKALALHLISMILIGIGFVISEFYIAYFEVYGCEESEGIAFFFMVVTTIVIVYIWGEFKKKKYVFTCKANRTLAYIDVTLMSLLLLTMLLG